MRGSQKKCENLHFLSLWAKKAHFGLFLAKTVKIIKKALGTFFSHLQALTKCKVSEKSNERFSRNCVTNERTDERTNGRDSLGLFSANRRETKNVHFWTYLGHFKGIKGD